MVWLSKLLVLSFVFVSVSFVHQGAYSQPTQSQVKKAKFEKKSLQLDTVKLSVEIADTEDKQELGLMFRKKLRTNEGMLFIFTDERPRAFWMKNTFLDLDIGFFDKKKKLIDVQTMTAMKSVMDKDLPSYTSAGPAQYALEVPKGWFEKHKIKTGTTFILK